MKFPPDLSIRLSGPNFLIRLAWMGKKFPKKPVSRSFLAQTFTAIYPDLFPGLCLTTMASFPSDALDNLFATASGPVLHRDIRATVAEDIRSKLHDPFLDAFSNLRRMTADEISHFDPLRSSAPGGCVAVLDRFDYSSGDDSSDEGGGVLIAFVLLPSFSTPLGNTRRRLFIGSFCPMRLCVLPTAVW